jgi:uncharacterized phiE125 gp8 family phage protein
LNSKTYTLLTPPATEPVALADVKTFLRIDGNEDDSVLTMLIKSARRMAEEYTKRAFITQTWRLTMDSFAGDCLDNIPVPPYLRTGLRSIPLSRQPIQSIDSIYTKNSANVATVVDADTYTLDDNEVLLNEGHSWPTNLREHSAVGIEFVAGWENADEVPEPIKQGIIQHVAASYSNKVCAEIPEGAKALYDPFRLAEAFGAF